MLLEKRRRNRKRGREKIKVGETEKPQCSAAQAVTKIASFSAGKNGLRISQWPCKKRVLQWVGARHDRGELRSHLSQNTSPLVTAAAHFRASCNPRASQSSSCAQVTWVPQGSSPWEQVWQLKAKQHYTGQVITRGCKGVVSNIHMDTATECTDTGRRPWRAQTETYYTQGAPHLSHLCPRGPRDTALPCPLPWLFHSLTPGQTLSEDSPAQC